jgi:glucose-1-phosphate cytidylyltransferase
LPAGRDADTYQDASSPCAVAAVKAVILAGGLGTRISEETSTRPKPMVEIGGRPVLWHIMKSYSAYGIDDFVVCCGYKGYVIKEFFANYALHASDVTFDLRDRSVRVHSSAAEPWCVTLVDTGDDTMTGGRLKRVRRYVDDGEPFCFTYGDGVSDVDIAASVAHHRASGAVATMTTVQPPGRFGAVRFEEQKIISFDEKPQGDGAWINGGYFVLSPKVGKYLHDDSMPWEREPMETLAGENQVAAYKHDGFWQPMDTMHDRNLLEDLWRTGRAPWKVW